MAVRVPSATGAQLQAALAVWAAANTARGRPPFPERVARVRDKLTDSAALLPVAGEQPAVVGMLLAEDGRPGELAGEAGRTGHLSMLFVRPGWQGRGVGADLLADLVARARGRGWQRLSVWTGRANEPARRLYGRQGFAVTPDSKTLATGILVDRWERVLEV